MGPQEVKNIAEPVSAYRLVPGPVSMAEAKKTPGAGASAICLALDHALDLGDRAA